MDVEKKVIVQDEEIEDDEEEDEVVEGSAAAVGGDAAAKKKNKKKNKKKKKKAAATAAGPGTKLPPFRGVTGFTDSYIQYGQTEPPTIPVAKLFAVGSFPKGEEQNHPGDFNTYRITSEELRAAERENEAFYDRVRYASEVHRQVRKFAQGLIKPGIRLIDLCEALENKNRELVEEAGFARGIGFPTGCSLNHVAAHYTPNAGDHTVYVVEDMECSHYAKAFDAPHVPLRLPRAKKLLSHIQRTFGTLPFCRRWLEREDGGSSFINPKGAKQEKYIMGLKNLVDNGIVTAYPPLCDIKGSYTSQYEHTLILRPTCKEVLSRGDDY
ncbi:hypothetical protein DYB28_004494 [Aphanomyces astaci]|uniref:Peptidase M24 domain-containing protein n=1 Tax=Aphanomyces astaci TaxID=112090 RepID=A0A9X8HCT0_APHAT|nr:hypothetical protein DYB28_004494 [Aphanomyces astaci]